MTGYVDAHRLTGIEFLPGGWNNICTVHLEPGNHLVVATLQSTVGGQFGTMGQYGAIYDHNTTEWHCLQWHWARPHWSHIMPLAAIVQVAVAGDYSLAVTGGPWSVVADPTTFPYSPGAHEPFFDVLPVGTESTHITAIDIGDADFVIGTPIADAVMPDKMTPVEVTHVDLPHAGSWLLISTATFYDPDRMSDSYFLWFQGASGQITRYIECSELDFFTGRQSQYQIHGVVQVEAAETWKMMAQVGRNDPVGPTLASVPRYAPGIGSERPGTAGLMLAVEVSPANVLTQVLQTDLPLPGGSWVQGPTLPLTEGDWFIMGTAHYYKASAADTWLASAMIYDTTTNLPYRAKSRYQSADLGGETTVVNVCGAIITVPEGEVHEVCLRIRADGPSDAYSIVNTICVSICPTQTFMPGPPYFDPVTGIGVACEDVTTTFPRPAASATCITAIHLPLNKNEIGSIADKVRLPVPIKPRVDLFRKDITPV